MMRIALVTLALAALSTPLLSATPDFGSHETIYLDGAADLAQLKASNPDHYARVMRIFAAANRLCDENLPRRQYAGADLRDFYCGMLLRTSNPAKWQIRFRLDDTRYVALVTVTADPPKPVPAR